jgi:hypothetical protein
MLCGLHYKLGSTFSLILALAAFLIYSRLRPGDSRLRTFVLLLLLIPFLYWIAGSGVFLFFLCVIIFTLVQKNRAFSILSFPYAWRCSYRWRPNLFIFYPPENYTCTRAADIPR